MHFTEPTIADQRYRVNTAITALELPEATPKSNSSGTLSYTLTPDLPAGLSFDASTRQISGTPTEIRPATSYTYKAKDEDGDEATLTFELKVEGDTQPSFGDTTITDQNWALNQAIRALQLPAASGGNGPLAYSITPTFSYGQSFPGGLSFDADTRQISGTPNAAQVPTSYTYKAADEDGDEATLTFRIHVNVTDSAPKFGDATIDDLVVRRGSAVGALQLPNATSGNGEIRYSISPDLPDGLSFDASTRQITGAPRAMQPAASYTYEAEDADGDEVTLTFTIAVLEADKVPSFGDAAIADRSWSLDRAIRALQLPAASSGNGALSYTLTPDLPAGLSFDASTRQIVGTPTTLQSAASYTYKAADEDGDEATLTFTIAVEADAAPGFGDAAIADRSWSQGRAIRALQLPAASGGNGALSYTLTPDLPAGLSFDASTRQIAGAPPTLQSAASYTYRVADQDNDEATLTFTIAVEADAAPGFGDAAIADRVYAQNAAIDALQLPRATGGNGALSYSISPDLPAGLSFDASMRQIVGAPTTLQSAASYTYRVADQDNDEATLTFTIAVVADTAPSFGDAAIADQSYALDRTIGVLQLPAASGGNGALTYTLTPELPDGLSLDASTRQITGAPTALQEALTYSWRAVDADFNRSGSDAATLSFTIEVTTAEMERRTLKHMLAATARATLAGAVDVIGRRFDAAPGGPGLSLAGRRIGGAPPVVDRYRRDRWDRPDRRDDRATPMGYSMDGSSLLRDSAFTLPLAASGAAPGGPGWTVWGRGDWRGFEGRKDGGSWDGEQRTGWLGVDARLDGGLTAGLALSQGKSEADYRLDESGGRLETSLTTVWPYVQVTTGNGGALRAVLGRGAGEAEHRASEGDGEQADLSLLAGSVSGRLPVARRGGFSWSAFGGVSLARIETEGSSATSIGDLKATNWRLRGGAEASHDGIALSSGSGWLLQPRGALAVRKDSGDGVTGIGVELSGGARLASAGGRFGLDASSHWLALHSADGMREWGASLEARFAPAADGRGLSLALGPAWGPQQGGVLERERLFDEARDDAPQRLSMTARAGYGFAAAGGLLTPFAELAVAEDGGETRSAAGLAFAAPGGVDARLATEHRDAEARIGLQMRLAW